MSEAKLPFGLSAADWALLNDAVDGRLDEGAHRALRVRVQDEPTLARAWAALQQTRSGLQALSDSDAPAPAEFGASVQAALKGTATNVPRGKLLRFVGWAYAAAAMLVMGLTTWWFIEGGRTQQTVQQDPVAVTDRSPAGNASAETERTQDSELAEFERELQSLRAKAEAPGAGTLQARGLGEDDAPKDRFKADEGGRTRDTLSDEADAVSPMPPAADEGTSEPAADSPTRMRAPGGVDPGQRAPSDSPVVEPPAAATGSEPGRAKAKGEGTWEAPPRPGPGIGGGSRRGGSRRVRTTPPLALIVETNDYARAVVAVTQALRPPAAPRSARGGAAAERAFWWRARRALPAAPQSSAPAEREQRARRKAPPERVVELLLRREEWLRLLEHVQPAKVPKPGAGAPAPAAGPVPPATPVATGAPEDAPAPPARVRVRIIYRLYPASPQPPGPAAGD